MANVTDVAVESQYLHDIADAIREKGGTTAGIEAKDLAAAVLALPTGGVEEYNFGLGLLYDPETRTVSVNLSTAVQEGDLRPVTSAAVAAELGDISGMLDDI